MKQHKHGGPIGGAIVAVLPEIEDTIRQLLAGGATVDQTVDHLATIADAADDQIVALIPAPVGPLVELIDGPAIRLGLRALVHAVRRRMPTVVPVPAPAPAGA